MSDIQWGTVGEWFGGIATTAAVIAGARVIQLQLRLGRAQLADITESQVRKLNVSYFPIGHQDNQVILTNHSNEPFREIRVIIPNKQVPTSRWRKINVWQLGPGETKNVDPGSQAG